MTGSDPAVSVAVDQPRYRRGAQVVATATTVDPDTRTVPIALDGVAPDGTAMHLQGIVSYIDTAAVTWCWDDDPTTALGTGSTLTMLAPARTRVLRATVVDAQGHTVTATCPVPVQGLLLGVDVDTTQTPAVWLSELNQVIAGKKPDGGWTKLFQTTGLPIVSKWPVPAGMVPHYTFAQIPTEAAFRAWVASLGPSRITPIQEIDRKMSLADAAATYARVASWMDSAPPGVLLVPNITASWQENPSAGKGQGKQWSAWAQAFAAIPGISELGVDFYVGGLSGYRPIDAQLEPAAAAAEAAGLDLVAPEWAVVVPPGATADNYDERARWITATLATIDSAGVVAAAWWNGPPTSQKGTFRLAAGDPGWDALRSWWTAA